MKKIKNKIMSIFYATRDAFSLTISKIPIKLGELCIGYEIISSLNKKIHSPRTKSEYLIIFGLLINLVLAIIFSTINYDNINHSFFLKFVAKNLFYFTFLLLIIITRKKVNNNLIENLCKLILIVQIPFFVLEYVFHIQVVGFNFIEPIQKIMVGKIQIYRFIGTASEPAYIVPILAMPLYYFTINKKGNEIYLFLAVFYLIITFSPFALCILILNYVFSLIRILQTSKRNFINRICSLTIIAFILIIFALITPFRTYLFSMINKMLGFLTGGNSGVMDWSATDRSQHLQYSIELFKSSSFFKKIFGNGTGFYYFSSLHNSNLLVNDVEEAYNLYLSTLVDRGIIGLVNLLCIFVAILKIESRDTISKAIKFGILTQFVHYLLVGNMWLYFLWTQVAILIAYNNYLKGNDDCEDLYTSK